MKSPLPSRLFQALPALLILFDPRARVFAQTEPMHPILSSTNVSLPAASWSVIQTGSFDLNGSLLFTNTLDPNGRQRFYQLQLQ